MTKKPTSADKVALYEKLVGSNPDVELKGATVPYTSFNGHMFSYCPRAEFWRLGCQTESAKPS